MRIASAGLTNLYVILYDLVLMPIDEWTGDFVDAALEEDSGIANGYALDADSVTHIKRSLRALVHTADASQFVRSVYEHVNLGPALLQANADQNLYFLSAIAVAKGTHTAGAGGTLTDTYADFVDMGVKPDMIVHNVTTGASARIISVTQTTCTSWTIAGGWNNGDVYYIVCQNWRSDPTVIHSIKLEHVARYLSMRGNR